MSEITLRVAMKAVILNADNKVLILREANTYVEGTQTGRYHVPGGRVDAGEHFESALRREVHEETGLDVEILYPIYVGEWRPEIKGVKNQIIATFIVCKTNSEAVVLSEEHDHFVWIDASEYFGYDLMDPEDKVLDRLALWLKQGLPPKG
jgi:8-oxo-dGTP diphosphatase